MRKIILLLAIAFCFGTLQAQVISTDTVTSAEVQRINQNLGSFYKANRASQRWYAASVVCFVGNSLIDNSNNKGMTFLPIIGTASAIIGTLVYLGSYKFLNPTFKKHAKAKPKM